MADTANVDDLSIERVTENSVENKVSNETAAVQDDGQFTSGYNTKKWKLIEKLHTLENTLVKIPHEYHVFLRGRNGNRVKNLEDSTGSIIHIPHLEEKLNYIKITAETKEILEKTRCELEHIYKDMSVKGSPITVEVDPFYHGSIIGHLGERIRKLCVEHDVEILFPDRDAKDKSSVSILGSKENAQKAHSHILQIVEDQKKKRVTIAVSVDYRANSRIIGTKCQVLCKIEEDYNVKIHYPRLGSSGPNIFSICGSEKAVEQCKEHIKRLETKFMQMVWDKEKLQQPQDSSRNFYRSTQYSMVNGFVVLDAPWHRLSNAANSKEMSSSIAVTATPNYWHRISNAATNKDLSSSIPIKETPNVVTFIE